MQYVFTKKMAEYFCKTLGKMAPISISMMSPMFTNL